MVSSGMGVSCGEPYPASHGGSCPITLSYGG
ncbi:hypothetical protein [Aeromonas salmonicida]